MRHRQTDDLWLSSTLTSADTLPHPASLYRSMRLEDGRGTPQRDAACRPWPPRSRSAWKSADRRVSVIRPLRCHTCSHAQIQHRRSRRRSGPLLHPAAGASESRRSPGIRQGQAVLRAARAPADGQDLHPARVAGSAEQRRGGRLPLRVCEYRGRSDRARRRGTRHACHSWRAGRSGALVGRRVPGPALVRCPGEIRSRTRTRCCVDPLVHGRSEASGAADRRDRHPDRGLADLRAPAVARRLRPASRELSTERGGVRSARRARLPHPFELGERSRCRWQRIQREGRIAAHRGLHGGRGARAARPAHRGDRAGVSLQRRSIRCGRRPAASRGW